MGRKNCKIKHRAEISQFNPVPLYRSYGVTKKEYWLVEKLLIKIQQLIAILILSVPMMALCLGIYAVMSYTPLLVKTVLWALIGACMMLLCTRTFRKRFMFYTRLKRLCKERKYKLYFQRGFFESLRWSSNKCDIVLETSKCIYYAHLLAVKKYSSKLCFDSEIQMHTIYHPIKPLFATIFDIKSKIKKYDIDFSCVPEYMNEKRVVKVIIVNPVCEEMLCKNFLSTVITGNGGEHFGYIVFAGTAFINFVLRNEN